MTKLIPHRLRRPAFGPRRLGGFVPLLCTLLAIGYLLLFSERALAQRMSVVNSPHNLSATGPGKVRATSEEQVCIFCHTPHHASAVQPLWNRNTPPTAYRPYSSNSLDAKPGQPTGTSKLCLSCHDGTIAVGPVVSRNQPIPMAGGITTLPPGRSNLGTDLSDDHPISFPYDINLVAKDPKLKDPRGLPEAVKLDHNGELQCSSCHDAHDNSKGNFLVMDNVNSQLCNSCHRPQETTVSGHQQCAGCHQPHTAPSGALLLKGDKVASTCVACHSGATGVDQGADVATDMNKASRHDTAPSVNVVDRAPNDVSCNDCHGSHSMRSETTVAPHLPGVMGKVLGVNLSGTAVSPATYEYEVCFRCHAEQQPARPASNITRQITQLNTRLEFSPTAVSSHPVTTPGKNPDVPSLRQGLSTGSQIYCSDCHASDTSRKWGGAGADGPHGSNVRPLLAARYDTRDNSAESALAYALCYKCHDRASILADQSFPTHKKHIVDARTPCSVCHDAHGISSTQGSAMNHSNLINFDISVVTPDAVNRRIEFRDQGVRSGSCTLSCHGREHNNLSY